MALKSNIKYKFWKSEIGLKQERIGVLEKILLNPPEKATANEIFAMKRELKALRQSLKSLIKNVEQM